MSEYLRNLYSNTFGNGDLEQYWRCAYHGRTKSISLYVIGCDKFNGLLILDDNLYSIMPVTETSQQEKPTSYRLDLLQPTVKLRTNAVKQVNNTFSSHKQAYQDSQQEASDSPVLVNFHIDKHYFTEFLLTNSQLLHAYFRNMVIQSHLTWSYFYHEHRTRLQFSAIKYIDLKRVHKKSKLFNMDPMELLAQSDEPTFHSLENIYQGLYGKAELPANQLNIYSIPSLTWNSSRDG